MSTITFAGFTSDDPEIALKREADATYSLLVPFRYQDPEFGTITVPRDVGSFKTNLASLPWFTTWFAPMLGAHMPAVLLHDALIHESGPPTYSTRDGHVIGPDAADRIFGDAMKASGTPVVRRVIMWSGASLGTAFARSTIRKWAFYIALIMVTSFHLLDITGADRFRLIPGVPWLPESDFFVEWAVSALAVFVIMSVVGPLILSARYAKATTTQAVIFGLTFLPVLFMLPARLLFVWLPENLLSR